MFVVSIWYSEVQSHLRSRPLPSLEEADIWRRDAMQRLIDQGWRRKPSFDLRPTPFELDVINPVTGTSLSFKIIPDATIAMTPEDLLTVMRDYWHL